MFRHVAAVLVPAALALFGARAGYVIEGQVQDERGEVRRDVQVCAYPEGFDQNRPGLEVSCTRSDARGRFTLDVSRPGKYTLFYEQYALGYWPTAQPFFRHPSSPAPEVVLDEGKTTASVNISMLPKNALLAGRGVDAGTGLAVDDLEFILCHADAPRVCRVTHAKDAEGRFRIPAPHVPFVVRVRAEGYDDWFGPDGGERETAMSLAGVTTQELDVRLKRSAGSAGRALDESDKRPGVHLPAPAQLAPEDKAVFDHYPRRTRLEWAPVEGAVSYRVEVDYCAGRREGGTACLNPQPLMSKVNPAASGIDGTSYEFDFIGMQPGRWRVWAVDAAGREGSKSPWRVFAYLK